MMHSTGAVVTLGLLLAAGMAHTEKCPGQRNNRGGNGADNGLSGSGIAGQ